MIPVPTTTQRSIDGAVGLLRFLLRLASGIEADFGLSACLVSFMTA